MSQDAKPQSEQEGLVRDLSVYSVGAASLFVPEKSGNYEPADLVWACNGVCVLIYMCASKKGVQESIDHNLAQAKGALRRWRLGNALTVANGIRSISISATDIRHVIVLSVVGSPGGIAEFDEAATAKLGISACCTIPDSILLRFAAVGCSLIDLVAVIAGLRISKRLDEAAFHRHWTGAMLMSAKLSGADKLWDFRQGTSGLNSYYESLEPLLHARKDLDDGNDSILNDLLFEDTLRVCVAIRKYLDLSKTSNQASISSVALKRYDVGLCIVRNMANPESQKFARSAIRIWGDHKDEPTKLRPGPRFVIDPWANWMAAYAIPRIGTSTTETIVSRLHLTREVADAVIAAMPPPGKA